MKRYIVKLLVFIARKIDFETLKFNTFKYFEEQDPKHAIYTYELRACILKGKERMKNYQPDDEEWEV